MPPDYLSKSPFRVCGLGFAFAEALRYSYGPGVTAACSSMACTYIIFHAFQRGVENENNFMVGAAVKLQNENNFMVGAADSLIFDSFASAVIPSSLTYHVCRLTYIALYDQESGPGIVSTWGPTIAGFLVLALTVDKVDELINHVMDKTTRKNRS